MIHINQRLPADGGTPLVSITLPTYNHGRYLRAALESVLHQSYRHLEVLLVDDGSTDDTPEIIRDLAARDARLKVVTFRENRGVMAALSDAWLRASGTFIYQFSSDDALCDPDFLNLGVAAIAAHPTAAGYYGLAQTISAETGDLIGQIGSGVSEGYIGPVEFMRGFLAGAVFVPGISSLWRRDLLNGLGGYDLDLGPQADYFVNHVLPARHGVVFANRVFAKTRTSERSASYSATTAFEDVASRLALFERKMRQAGLVYGSEPGQWDAWRHRQLISIAIQKAPAQRAVTAIKMRLRSNLPRWVFSVINVAWRYTIGRLMRATFALSPAVRRRQTDVVRQKPSTR